MASLSRERNAVELRNLVQSFLQRFREADAAAVNGPHADLSMQELRVVEFLGDVGPTRMKELAEYMLLAVNSVTSLVDKLETQGLVQRERSDDDRRVVFVKLTDLGREAYGGASRRKVVAVAIDAWRAGYTRARDFMMLFRKIAGAGRE